MRTVSTLVLFGNQLEPEAFDEYFERHHRPLLLQIPGLELLKINRIAGAAAGDSPFSMIAELQFASEEAMQRGLNSEAGQAMARDLGQFASGGATVLFAWAAIESPGA